MALINVLGQAVVGPLPQGELMRPFGRVKAAEAVAVDVRGQTLQKLASLLLPLVSLGKSLVYFKRNVQSLASKT